MFSLLLALGSLLATYASADYPAMLTASTIHDGSFRGYVSAFSTGNGTNAAVLVNSTSQALTGHFKGSYWVFNGFNNQTYSLYMEPTADSAQFPLYGSVGINLGLNTDGFGNTLADGGETQTPGLLVWEYIYGAPADEGPDDFSTWAVCTTLIPGYESAGVQSQVFWASQEIVNTGGVPNCTFIALKGADVSNQGP